MSDLEDCVRIAVALFDDDTVYVAVWLQGAESLDGEGFGACIERDTEEISSAYVKPTAEEAVKALREDLLNRCKMIESAVKAVKSLP